MHMLLVTAEEVSLLLGAVEGHYWRNEVKRLASATSAMRARRLDLSRQLGDMKERLRVLQGESGRTPPRHHNGGRAGS